MPYKATKGNFTMLFGHIKCRSKKYANLLLMVTSGTSVHFLKNVDRSGFWSWWTTVSEIPWGYLVSRSDLCGSRIALARGASAGMQVLHVSKELYIMLNLCLASKDIGNRCKISLREHATQELSKRSRWFDCAIATLPWGQNSMLYYYENVRILKSLPKSVFLRCLGAPRNLLPPTSLGVHLQWHDSICNDQLSCVYCPRGCLVYLKRVLLLETRLRWVVGYSLWEKCVIPWNLL
jgi:hypothetical protein